MTQDNTGGVDYLTHWQLARPVFLRAHGDDDLFFPPAYQADLQRLRYHLAKGSTGVITISMPAGHGKSSLLRHCYQGLALDGHEALLLSLYQGQNQGAWLLPKLARFLGVAAEVEAMAYALDELAEEKRRLCLLVDEADKLLTPEAFTEIHALLSLPNVRAVELGVVMAGSDGWERGVLSQSALAPHVRLAAHFPAYGWPETEAFFTQAMRKSGLSPSVFVPEVVVGAHTASQGILARLAHILESCLVEACLMGKHQVDAAVMQAVLASIGYVGEAVTPVVAKTALARSLATKAEAAKSEAMKTEVAEGSGRSGKGSKATSAAPSRPAPTVPPPSPVAEGKAEGQGQETGAAAAKGQWDLRSLFLKDNAS